MCQRYHRNVPARYRVSMVTPTTPALTSTPSHVVDVITELCKLRPSDITYDLGCGDGRYVIAAARQGILQAVGLDLLSSRVATARQRIADAGLTNATVMQGDITKADLSQATVATMFLYPETIAKVVPKLTNARLIVSYQHPLPLAGTVQYTIDGAPVYVWERKA